MLDTKILVIDDDENICELLMLYFETILSVFILTSGAVCNIIILIN